MPNSSSKIPVSDRILDFAGKVTMRWLLFFQELIDGDPGQRWAPNIVGLSNSGGAPTITGVYYQNSGFIDFYVRIVPAGGGNTSATAGSTYVELPFQPTSDCACFATTGNNGSAGGIVSGNKRAYPPSWTNLTDPVTISGRVPLRA